MLSQSSSFPTPALLISSLFSVLTILVGILIKYCVDKYRRNTVSDGNADVLSPNPPSSAHSDCGSIIPEEKYDVFLSFRGEDTRPNFTSHLHRELSRKQIKVFFDEDELDRGDQIEPSLFTAIERSKISVIVFSENYASSRWCLHELVKIIECKNASGLIVLLVFYRVNPADLRKQSGGYGKALAKHKKKESKEKIQEWKNALAEAANISGWDSSGFRSEALLVEDIANKIVRRLNQMSTGDDKGLIGTDSKLEEIESLLCRESVGIRTVGIWGMGGIGKTTIADTIFHKVANKFEFDYCRFIPSIRDESNNGLIRWKHELLSTILEDNTLVVTGNPNIGLGLTNRRLEGKKVFIVFDDVTEPRQIESIVGGGLDCFHSSSIFIMTSRNRQVLIMYCKEEMICEVNPLSDHHSLQLFSLFAFQQNWPLVGFAELSKEVVKYARGVPLALKLVGCALAGKKKGEWVSELKKLEKTPDRDLFHVLKISYDGLDDQQRDIFLDIACFFKSETRDSIINILDGCGYCTEIELSVLIDKCLLSCINNRITTHDLLQDMGREIVRLESIKNPGERSRLWHHDDIYQVLLKNTGTKAIEGISLDISKIREIRLNRNVFSKMQHLRLLIFYDSNNQGIKNKLDVSQDLESCFYDLRYLRWDQYPLKCLQNNFHPEHLVELDLRHSNVEQLWDGVQRLGNIKSINLFSCEKLISLPDLSEAKNLERLKLDSCTSLLEMPSSVQYLDKLVTLSLLNCKSIRSLPTSIHMKNLKRLVLVGCESLKVISEIPCNINELRAGGTALEELPPSMNNLCSLEILHLRSCSRLKSFASNVSEWKSLSELDVYDCLELERLPDGFWNLKALKKLIAKRTGITEISLPSSTICLNKLWQLNLSYCHIEELPENLGHLSSLKYLFLKGNYLRSIPKSIVKLENLKGLYVSHCNRLQSLPELPTRSLQNVEALCCTSLEALSGLQALFAYDDKRAGEPWHTINFFNCLSLDTNALKDVMEEVLPRTRPTSFESFVRNRRRFPCPRIRICYPGSNIPKWFAFQRSGSLITAELLPIWLQKGFFDIVFCVVIAFNGYQDTERNYLFVKAKSKSRDGIDICTIFHWSYGVIGPPSVGSDQVFVGYTFGISVAEFFQYCFNNKMTVQFCIEDRYRRSIESCQVKECGFHVI